MKDTVLSIDSDAVDFLEMNHREYANFAQSEYIGLTTKKIDNAKQKILFTYHKIYSILNAKSEGECLVVLNKYTVLYNFIEVKKIIGDANYMVFNQCPGSEKPMLGLLVFKHSLETLSLLSKFIFRLSHWATELMPNNKNPENIFTEVFNPHPCDRLLPSGYYGAVPAQWETNSFIDTLRAAIPFAVHCQPPLFKSGDISYESPGHDRRYLALVLYESESLRAGRPSLLEKNQNPSKPETSEVHLNSSANIAFVSLYTENIANYGALHLQTMLSYCERHGYGYHAHRKNPESIVHNVRANWAKAHLIRHYLNSHDFVIWIDADILAINQEKDFNEVLKGKDVVFGTDHTAWSINSCFVGFRKTEKMQAILNEICDQIEEIEDKDSVYASGGDQQVFWNVLKKHDLLQPPYWHDAVSLGTSPVYADTDSILVHFPAMHDPHRAAIMKVWLLRQAEERQGLKLSQPAPLLHS